MPDTNPIIGEIVSVDSLYIAPVLQDDANGYVTGTPEYFAPIGENKYDPKVSTASSAFDGRIMFNYLSEGISENTVTVSGLSEKKIAQITGKPYDPATGLVYDSGDLSLAPDYALGYRIEIGNGFYKYFWFLKGNFYLEAIDAKTKGEKIDAVSQGLIFLPKYTLFKWAVPDPKNLANTITVPQKRTIGDTSDPAFTLASTWFDQVVTPSSHTAPASLALSNCTPTDGATGVLVTIAPMLVFNNAIADYDSIALLEADGSVIANTMILSTDGKTLTITPTANLSAATAYTIVLAGITDIYGQKLATQTIKFTTA